LEKGTWAEGGRKRKEGRRNFEAGRLVTSSRRCGKGKINKEKGKYRREP